MGLRRRMRFEQLKIRYYARLNVHQIDRTTNRMENKYIKCHIAKWADVIKLFWNKYVQKNKF